MLLPILGALGTGVALLLSAIFGASPVLAAGSGTITQLDPWVTSAATIKLSSTTASLRVPSLTNCDTIDTNSLGVLTCGSDATGAGGSFPFTTASYGNSTSTTIGFLAGLISNGSTTISSITSGLVGNNNGRLYGFASSSLFGYTPLNPTRAINTTAPLQGGGDLSADRTLSITQAGTAANGYVSSTDFNTFNNKVSSTSLSGTAPITYSSVTGAIACNAASGSQAGCLSVADWLTFNNKVATGTTFTSSNVAYFGSNGTLFNIATGTVSAGSSAITVTGGRSVLGGALAIDCAVAATAQAGCLSIASFNAFNLNRIATSAALVAGQILYATSNAAGQTVAGVATGTISGAGGVTVTAGQLVIGSGLTITCSGASASVTGCLSSADWTTFNNKISWGAATSTSPNQFVYTDALGKLVSAASSTLTFTINGTALAVGASGTITAASSTLLGTDVNTFSQNTKFSAGLVSQASSTIGNGAQEGGLTVSGGATTTGFQVVQGTGTSTYTGGLKVKGVVVSGYRTPGFTLTATTTSLQGTTTIQLPSSFVNQTIVAAQCYTDTGTMNVDIYHTTTHLTFFNASTTQGIINFSSNNTKTAQEKWYVDVGTPASSPTKITCTFELGDTSY